MRQAAFCGALGLATIFALAAIEPAGAQANPASHAISPLATNPDVLRLLRAGDACPDKAPAKFYGPGLGGITWNVPDLGRLSAYSSTCAVTTSPFAMRCIITGPGSVSLKAAADDQILFYVPPDFTALFEAEGAKMNCVMVPAKKSSAGRRINKLIDQYTKSRANEMYGVGVSALRSHDFLDAGSYLAIKFEPMDSGYLAGTIFDRGLDGYQNKPLAAYLIGRSASQGYFPAQRRLGEMYRDGIGVAADPQTANFWLHAAKSNPNKAHSALDQLVETAQVNARP